MRKHVLLILSLTLLGSSTYAEDVKLEGPKEPGGQLNKAIRKVVVEISDKASRSSPLSGVLGMFGSSDLSESTKLALNVCTLSDRSACKQFMDLGCSRTSAGAISGSFECWRGGRFRLMTAEGKPFIPSAVANSTYVVLAKVGGDTAGASLFTLKENQLGSSALLDESGTVLLEARALDCRTFAPSPKSGMINCVSGTKDSPILYPLDVGRIQQLKKASINLKDALGSFEIDLCGLAVNSLSEKAKQPNGFFRNLWNSVRGGDGVQFDEIAGPGKVAVGLSPAKGGMNGTDCTLAPKDDVTCDAVILSKDGVRCQNQGQSTPEHKLPIGDVDPSVLLKVAKMRIFKNREVVGVKEILAQATHEPRPTLQVTRPDLLLAKDSKWIFPAGTGGGSGPTGGQL